MKDFLIQFKSEVNGPAGMVGCRMHMTGNPEMIGSMLAKFALVDAKQGNPGTLRVLIAAFEECLKSGDVKDVMLPGQKDAVIKLNS